MNRDNAIETCGNCNKLVIAYTGTQAYICINPNALCICRGSSSDQLILRALEKQQAKIVKKISFMFGIPVSDLEKALKAKEFRDA